MITNISKEGLALVSGYRITSADCDIYARLKPSALLGFLIQSAIDSADRMGFGFRDLKKQKLFWVLSRLTLEMRTIPQWYDEIEIETWPRDIEKILYRRDFLIRQNGVITGRATSHWLAIDSQTKKPGKIDLEDEWMFISLRDKQAIEAAPEKIQSFCSKSSDNVETCFTDFDLNGHVTSTRYLEWVMNALPADFQRQHVFEKFIVNYIRETLPGERIQTKYQWPELKTFNFEAQHQSSGNAAFRSVVVFREI
ncbi:MAG: acyl-[acyl-carrier-protein] thioesterase [Bacteroidales bacterium]